MQYNGNFTLQWHITHRCNLRCKHCYQKDYSAFASREALELVLEQYKSLLNAYGFKGHINITGGEPLLHPDLYLLIEQAAKRDITTAVLTNGTMLGINDAQRLKSLGVEYVQVSLDGTRKTHDAIRGKGSFDEALEGIFNLKSFGIYTDVSFTAQRPNLRDLRKLATVCQQYSVDKLWFDRVIIPDESDSGNLSLSAEEYKKLCRQAARLNKRGMVSCGRALQFLPCRDKRIYKCTAGSTLLALLADGSVMPCRRLPINVGNVFSSDLLTIYRSSPVLNELKKAEIPEGCRNCKYAEACRGGAKCDAYAKTHSFSLPDPLCPVVAPVVTPHESRL